MGCEQLERGCILLSRLFKRQLLSMDGMFIHGLGAGYSSPKKVDSGASPEWTCGLGRKTPTRVAHVSLRGNRFALERVAVVAGLQQLTQWSRRAV